MLDCVGVADVARPKALLLMKSIYAVVVVGVGWLVG